MNKPSIISGLAFMAAVLCIGGCSQINELPKGVMYGSVPDGEWSYTWPLQLQFPGDTVAAELRGVVTDANIWVRYNLNAMGRVRLVVNRDGYGNIEQFDTLSFDLFKDNGKPIGEGSYGLYEVHQKLPGHVRLEDDLVYRIWPIGDSTGITDISIVFGNPGKFPLRVDFLK